jgi:hypothetical protein
MLQKHKPFKEKWALREQKKLIVSVLENLQMRNQCGCSQFSPNFGK